MIVRPNRLAPLLALLAACAGSKPAPAPQAPPPVAAAPAPAAPPASAVPGAPLPPSATPPDRAEVPPKGPPPQLALPEQLHFTLANGLKVRLVRYTRLPIVALNLVVDAGGAHDPADLPGLASLTADMLTEGTKTRSATQISDEIGFIGGSLDSAASQDSSSLVGASLARYLPKLLDVFADVAMNPTFPSADFGRVQDERLVTLLQQRDQPSAVASKAFVGLFWGGAHPYGHYVLGTEASVKRMRPADLARFHGRYWTPGTAELVVVGDVTEAALRALLEPTLGRWKAGSRSRPEALEPPASPRRTLLLEKPGAPQAFLLLGMPGIPRSSPDFVAATLAFEVLGGGSSSRLFRTLREAKGYTYGIYAHGESRRLGGASLVVGSVKAEVTGAALKDLLAEIARLRTEPVPKAELDDAKNALVLSLPAEFATAGGIASKLGELAVYGLPDDYWNTYADAIRRVTPEDVQHVADKYLDPSRLTLVMVANPQAVKPQLADLPIGPLEVRAAPATPVLPGAPRVRPGFPGGSGTPPAPAARPPAGAGAGAGAR